MHSVWPAVVGTWPAVALGFASILQHLDDDHPAALALPDARRAVYLSYVTKCTVPATLLLCHGTTTDVCSTAVCGSRTRYTGTRTPSGCCGSSNSPSLHVARQHTCNAGGACKGSSSGMVREPQWVAVASACVCCDGHLPSARSQARRNVSLRIDGLDTLQSCM